MSTITVYIYNKLAGLHYLYGIANDKINYLRSEDLGRSWKYVAKNEYDTVMNKLTVFNCVRNKLKSSMNDPFRFL